MTFRDLLHVTISAPLCLLSARSIAVYVAIVSGDLFLTCLLCYIDMQARNESLCTLRN